MLVNEFLLAFKAAGIIEMALRFVIKKSSVKYFGATSIPIAKIPANNLFLSFIAGYIIISIQNIANIVISECG